MLQPFESERDELFSALEEMFAVVQRYPRQELYIPLHNGKFILLKVLEGGLRIYLLPTKQAPGYLIHHHCEEHFLIDFTSSGKIEKINRVDVVGMRRNHVSGYQSAYWNPQSTEEMDAITVAQTYMPQLRKYIEAFRNQSR